MTNELKQSILDAHLSKDGKVSSEILKEAKQLHLANSGGILTSYGDQIARQYAQEKHPEWTKK